MASAEDEQALTELPGYNEMKSLGVRNKPNTYSISKGQELLAGVFFSLQCHRLAMEAISARGGEMHQLNI